MESELASLEQSHILFQQNFAEFDRDLKKLTDIVDKKFEIFEKAKLLQNMRDEENKEDSKMEAESTTLSNTPRFSENKRVDEENKMLREEEYLLGNVERIQLPDYMPNELLEELKKMFAKLVKQNPEKKFIEPVNFRNRFQAKEYSNPKREDTSKYFKEKFSFILSNNTSNGGDNLFTILRNNTINEGDLERLAPDVYLNDNLINLHVKLALGYLMSPKAKLDIHIFNTYFYMSLTATIAKEMEASESDYAEDMIEIKTNIYKKVYRSYRNIEMVSKKHILFPIHNHAAEHWYLYILSNMHSLRDIARGKVSLENLPPEERPYILHLDSLSKIDSDFSKKLRLFAEIEINAKLGTLHLPGIIPKIEENEEGMNQEQLTYFNVTEDILPAYQLLVPRQHNLTECGCFLLEFIDSFCYDPSYVLKGIPDDIDKTRMFPTDLANYRRELMSKFIINIKKGSSVEDAAALMKSEWLEKRTTLYREDDPAVINWDNGNFEEFCLKKEDIDSIAELDQNQLNSYKIDYSVEVFYNIILKNFMMGADTSEIYED